MGAALDRRRERLELATSALELAAQHAELELRQVRAGEVVRQVGRREAKRAVGCEAHHPQYQPPNGARLRLR